MFHICARALLTARYLALSGVAPQTHRGARAVQLSTREMQGKLLVLGVAIRMAGPQ